MRPSTSLRPLAAKRPKTIASQRICCHLQQRYASTSKDVPPAPGSTEAETKKNEANYKRMQMMRDPPNLTVRLFQRSVVLDLTTCIGGSSGSLWYACCLCIEGLQADCQQRITSNRSKGNLHTQKARTSARYPGSRITRRNGSGLIARIWT